MMDAKCVRNMYSILVVVNKHNTARVASCWFIIYHMSFVLQAGNVDCGVATWLNKNEINFNIKLYYVKMF